MSARLKDLGGTSARAWIATATPSVVPAARSERRARECHRVTDVVTEQQDAPRSKLFDERGQCLTLGHGTKGRSSSTRRARETLQDTGGIHPVDSGAHASCGRGDIWRGPVVERDRGGLRSTTSHGSWTARGTSSASRSAM